MNTIEAKQQQKTKKFRNIFMQILRLLFLETSRSRNRKQHKEEVKSILHCFVFEQKKKN